MIRLIKINNIYYLKSQYLSARDFQEVLKVYRKYKLRFDAEVQASTHSNPKILLDCLYELGDRFDTKSDKLLEQEIESYSPFKPSFKIKRRKLEKSFFEKYPPIGKFQEEDVYKMFSLGRCLNANKMGLGKGQPHSSKVLTLSGWKDMRDIQEGDLVANEKGSFSKVLKVFPLGKRDIYKVTFSDGCSTNCTEDHLWTYRTHNDAFFGKDFKRSITTKELLDKKIPYSSMYIPLVKPIQFPERELKIDPWLMGVILGNGCTKSGSLTISTTKDFLIDKIREKLRNTNCTLKPRYSNSFGVTMTNSRKVGENLFINELKKQNLFGVGSVEKFIPTDYLYSSSEQRLALLTGLIDTDGYVSKKGDVLQYSTSSEYLMRDVTFLVQSLGGLVKVSSKIPKIGNKEYSRHWTLTLKLPEGVIPISIPYKLERFVPKTKYQPVRILRSVEYSHEEEASCILIDSDTHLYVTENCIVTHNTYESIQTINQYFHLQETDCVLIVAIPSVLYNWKREILNFSNYFSYDDIVIVNKDNRDIFNSDNLPPVLIMSYNTIKLVSEYCYLQKNPVKNIDKKTEAQIKKDKKKITALAKSTKTNTIPFEKWGSNRILILDEAHKAKNMQARQTKVLHQIKEYFEYRFLLTGTPHPNNIGELYSLIKLLDDNLIESNYNDFISTIAEIGTRFSAYAISEFKEKECNDFLERIKPYIIRRFLRDYVELPQVFYKNIYIEFSGKQYDLYQAIVNEALISLKSEKGKLHFRDIQTKFPYIIQMLSDPCLLKGKIDSKQSDLINTIDNWKFENGLKFKACKDLLTDIFEENKDAKVVIWAEHPETINRLAESFEKYGTLLVHGQSTPKGKDKDEWRDYLTQEVFKKDKEKRILIANPSTLGTGTNLQFVQQVITLDEDFSFVNKDQKKSRFERFGMVGEVTYWKIIIDKSLDCYIDKALANKELLDKIFLKDGLTISDIKSIFTGD